MKLKIKDIKIGVRQRIDLGDLSDLDSMSDKDVGQIQPIVVHKTLSGFELVAGRRRLAKAAQLGWEEIEAYEKDQLTPIQKEKQELFEDLSRKNRTWQELAIAVYKIHNMLVRDKRADGDKWTIRQSASFTNFGETTITWFVRLAKYLVVEPRDEELWKAETYTEAQQILIGRQEAETRAELERRRQALNKDQLPLPPEVVQPEGGPDQGLISTSEGEEGSAPTISTPSRRPRIYVTGFNLPFWKAKPDEHFLANRSMAILGWRTSSRDFAQIRNALAPEGFAVCWESEVYPSPLIAMPHQLIWNHIATEKPSQWPFTPNYSIGYVYARTDHSFPESHANPNTSVISCHPEGDELPFGVVDFTLRAICPPNLAVICPSNSPVVAVAESGHPCVWFEEDREKFDAKCKALREYYERMIPDIEVIMPGQ